jgi:uncharacterized protein (TIGR02646 family)
MIQIDRGPEPPGFRSLAEREAVAARKFYRTSLRRRLQKRFAFNVWRSADVRELLSERFHGKCAYCESFLSEGPPGVNPFRPLWAAQGGKRVWPDLYWWLGSSWSNLVSCCAGCAAAKGTRFPLRDERRRARGPGQELGEAPLYLNPCADRPQDHLVFAGDGTVAPAVDARGTPSPRGAATIDGLDLNRPTLVSARREKLDSLLPLLPRLAPFIRRAVPEALRIPADPRVFLGTLARECSPRAAHAAPARQFVAGWLRRISASWYETLFRAVPFLGEVLNEGKVVVRTWTDSGSTVAPKYVDPPRRRAAGNR